MKRSYDFFTKGSGSTVIRKITLASLFIIIVSTVDTFGVRFVAIDSPFLKILSRGAIILTASLFAMQLILTLIVIIMKSYRPAGSRLMSIADFLFSKKMNEKIFLPLIADWRVEYFEALKQGRTIKARWISIRYTYSFLLVMGISKAYSAIKELVTLGRAAGK